MNYLEITLIYLLSFLLFSTIYYKFIILNKNKQKIKSIDKILLWNIPKRFKLFLLILPKFTKKILSNIKRNLIEKQLIEVTNELIPLAEGGVSCFDSLEKMSRYMKEPIKNELLYLAIYSRDRSLKEALLYKKENTKEIFLKQFWQILYRYLINGGNLSNSLYKLRESIVLKIKINQKIKAKLLNSKLQLFISIFIPYIMFVITNAFNPSIISQIFKSKLGLYIIFFSQFMHLLGIVIFYKISNFKYKNCLKKALFINNIGFSLEHGISFYDAFKNCFYLLDYNVKKTSKINKIKTTYDLINFLNIQKDNDIKSLSKILKKNLDYGNSTSKHVYNLYKTIIENLEYRAMIFEQKLPSLTLIPLYLFIFPSTYLLILSPILIQLF